MYCVSALGTASAINFLPDRNASAITSAALANHRVQIAAVCRLIAALCQQMSFFFRKLLAVTVIRASPFVVTLRISGVDRTFLSSIFDIRRS
jgi:predicted RNA methylase